MSSRNLVRTVLILAFAGFLAECLLLWGYTMDDAFISFRYARNLARGEGLVYNPGQPPVEGYSNFLWTVLFAPVIGAGLNPEVVSKILGILCGMGIIGVTILLSRRLDGDSGFRCLGPVLVGTSPIMAMQAVTGLETLLFALFFLLGVWLTLREWEGPPRLPLSTLAFLGCALTRPEGVGLFAASLVVSAVLLRRPRGRGSKRSSPAGRIVLSVLIFTAVYGVYTVWRVSYFGSFLPNTFYAKTSGMEQIQRGWEYLRDFSIAYGGVLIYLFAFVAAAVRYREAAVRYLAGMAVIFLGMVVYEGGDWMPLFRLLAPVLPLLFLLFQAGMRVFSDGLAAAGRVPAEEATPAAARGNVLAGDRRTPSGREAAPPGPGSGPGQRAGVPAALSGRSAAVGGILAVLLVFSLLPLPGKAKDAMKRQDLYERVHRKYGRWLARHTPPGEPIALSDIGQFGYFSDLPVIDLVGLTNPEIARSPGMLHEKQVDPGIILAQRPAHIVIVCYNDNGTWTNRGFPVETALLASKEFQEMYGPPMLVYYTNDYSYWIFTRKDLAGTLGARGM